MRNCIQSNSPILVSSKTRHEELRSPYTSPIWITPVQDSIGHGELYYTKESLGESITIYTSPVQDTPVQDSRTRGIALHKLRQSHVGHSHACIVVQYCSSMQSTQGSPQASQSQCYVELGMSMAYYKSACPPTTVNTHVTHTEYALTSAHTDTDLRRHSQ